MKMSRLNSDLPKYYKGFDMDVLWKKALNAQSSDEEDDVLLEAYNKYVIPAEKKRNEEMDKKIEQARKRYPICGFPFFDPGVDLMNKKNEDV